MENILFWALVYCVLATIVFGIFYLLIKSAVKNGVKEAVSEMRHIFPVQQKNTRESMESDSETS